MDRSQGHQVPYSASALRVEEMDICISSLVYTVCLVYTIQRFPLDLPLCLVSRIWGLVAILLLSFDWLHLMEHVVRVILGLDFL